MAFVGAVTRQIAALELSDKNNNDTTATSKQRGGLTHVKPSSQSNVAKLLSKYAAPNPYPSSNKPTHHHCEITSMPPLQHQASHGYLHTSRPPPRPTNQQASPILPLISATMTVAWSLKTRREAGKCMEKQRKISRWIRASLGKSLIYFTAIPFC
jgi:hypothetical protein